MLANSYPSQQNNNVAQVNNQQSAQNQNQSTETNVLPQQPQLPPAPSIQTMRLRDDPPPVTPPTRSSRKRKSPPNANNDQKPQQQPAPPTTTVQHVLPPPHTLVHPSPHMQAHPIPPGYHFAPTDYTPGGMSASHPNQPPPPQGQVYEQDQEGGSPPGSAAGRALSSSKRAEQNRKAQRAFRERRDQHVKALESRSQLLDAALASADEANRRWEECRALVDQLRIENAALRATLSNMQMQQGVSGAGGPSINNTGSETSRPDTGSKE
jgi:hypothetical protein